MKLSVKISMKEVCKLIRKEIEIASDAELSVEIVDFQLPYHESQAEATDPRVFKEDSVFDRFK